MEKKTKRIVIIVIIIIIIPIISLGAYLSTLKKPAVEIEEIKYKSFDPNQLTLTFLVTVDVYNPNDISAKLKYIDVDVYIEGQFTGLVRQDVNEEIKGKEHTKLDLDFVLYNVPYIQAREIEVRVNGIARVTVFLLTFSIPLDETQVVEIVGSDGQDGNQPPTAVLMHDAGLVTRKGETITFDGTPSSDADGTIIFYSWDFGDGSPNETGPIVTHAYQSSGQFTVELTVYDDSNAQGTDNTVISVVGLG